MYSELSFAQQLDEAHLRSSADRSDRQPYCCSIRSRKRAAMTSRGDEASHYPDAKNLRTACNRLALNTLLSPVTGLRGHADVCVWQS